MTISGEASPTNKVKLFMICCTSRLVAHPGQVTAVSSQRPPKFSPAYTHPADRTHARVPGPRSSEPAAALSRAHEPNSRPPRKAVVQSLALALPPTPPAHQ